MDLDSPPVIKSSPVPAPARLRGAPVVGAAVTAVTEAGPAPPRRLVLLSPVAYAPVVWTAMAAPTETGPAPPRQLLLLATEVLMAAVAAPTADYPAPYGLLLVLPPEVAQEPPHTRSR